MLRRSLSSEDTEAMLEAAERKNKSVCGCVYLERDINAMGEHNNVAAADQKSPLEKVSFLETRHVA